MRREQERSTGHTHQLEEAHDHDTRRRHRRPLPARPARHHGGGRRRLTPEEVAAGIARHARGDWGDVGPEDAAANERSLREGRRLLSAYGRGDRRFWVISEADRSVTTVLLPDDY